MGFFSSITGWDKSMAALNAVMGNHVMENYDHSTKIMITDEIAKIISIARYGKLSKESILSELNKESRVVQMNFVALACDNLHIEPPFKNSYWERIKNPYATSAHVNEASIDGAIKAFRKEGNDGVTWPGISASFDFKSLYEETSSEANGAINETIVAIATQLILCFNSYLSEKTQLPHLGLEDMDVITEMALGSQNIEADQTLFSSYCFAVHDSALRHTIDDGINDGMAGKRLRQKLKFDDAFNSYCIDLGFNHLLESEISPKDNNLLYRAYISKEDEEIFGPDLIGLIDRVFNQTYSTLFSHRKAGVGEINQIDIEAFGLDLTGFIALGAFSEIMNYRATDNSVVKALQHFLKDSGSEYFGSDLINFIGRYCAYKTASLP